MKASVKDHRHLILIKSRMTHDAKSKYFNGVDLKSKILKFLKSSPFHSLIENKRCQKFQLHSPSSSDFMTLLVIFPSGFEDKMLSGTFSGYP